MGAWKDWQQGMIEDGDREIAAVAERIRGTLADPLIRRQLDQGLIGPARPASTDHTEAP